MNDNHDPDDRFRLTYRGGYGASSQAVVRDRYHSLASSRPFACSRFVSYPLAMLASCMFTTSPGLASSDAAYAAFRDDVAKRCTAQAKAEFADPIAIVDAHGSASYGIALIYGRPQTPKGMTQLPGLASVVCIYNKTTKKTELSGPIETNFTAH